MWLKFTENCMIKITHDKHKVKCSYFLKYDLFWSELNIKCVEFFGIFLVFMGEHICAKN